MFYAKSTSGFYSAEVHGKNIPSDAVEVTDAEYQELLAGQTQGKVIVANDAGNPCLLDPPEPPEPSYAQLRAAEYPSYADQFDLLYHGGIDAWKAAIQAVKIKYPKPEA